MGENYDTAMGLLGEAADALDAAATACEDEVDASDLSSLADRIRGYLSTSRPTTPLGMPRITSPDNQLSHDSVVARFQGSKHQHVRIVSD
jgi:hypothetical protein